MQTQHKVIASLPAHVQPFVAIQNYDDYTPRDHAIWRFLLHQLAFNLRDRAHPTYFEGLKKTGIGFEAIPKIEHINACMSELGWRAVAVDGFLPPAVFMELQAQRVLAIALNIRSFDHMLYTPAPDIIHESAGHAPFLVDIDYAEFLQRFGELGMQAIANHHDTEIYEAVRQLSITKEQVGSSIQEVEAAQQLVEQLQNKKVEPSEANLLARLHWWTVEYGLVGSIDDYRIFGAGLLSSLAESQSCMDNNLVTKKALSVNAILSSYDITTAQPQLYVTESCRHLGQVLDEYGRNMCCYRGGASSLKEAKRSGSVNTVTYNSGLQVAGTVDQIVCDAVGNAIYFNIKGPTQLAYQHQQLAGHDAKYHASGFASPIGKLRTLERCLSAYTVDELKRHSIALNQTVALNFLSGIKVVGTLENILRRDQKNILFTFTHCTVTDIDGEILFDPSWGNYDMAVGDSIVSVAGGSADKVAYPMYEAPSTSASPTKPDDPATEQQFAHYADLRSCREQHGDATSIIENMLQKDKLDWLLYFEALELASKDNLGLKVQTSLMDRLAESSGDQALLIQAGLSRIKVARK